MNYMRMVSIEVADGEVAKAKLICQQREEFFRNHFDNVKVIPMFIIFEAMFQTAGRVANERNFNPIGGAVVGAIKKFNFSRPIFADEVISIIAKYKSQISTAINIEVSVIAETPKKEIILKDGSIILAKHTELSKQLSNSTLLELQETINSFNYHKMESFIK